MFPYPLLLFPVLIYAFVAFDRLVRAEYEMDRTSWEADGSPAGFFWRSPECRWLRSDMARGRLCFRWLFRTPAWVSQSARSRMWLSHLRISVLAWNVGMVAFFIYYLMSR